MAFTHPESETTLLDGHPFNFILNINIKESSISLPTFTRQFILSITVVLKMKLHQWFHWHLFLLYYPYY